MATARNHRDSQLALTPSSDEAFVEFWPTLKDPRRSQGIVQPDVVIAFGNEIMIVEAKLWSSKSSADDGSDQLAREWRAVADHHGARAHVTALLYVTRHVEPPVNELEESAKALEENGDHLWWLSWSSLAPILERQIEVGDRMTKLVVEDLLAYLRAANVLRFRGWQLALPWKRNECWRYRPQYWGDYSIRRPIWRYP